MDEAKLYEQLGRKQAALEQLNASYDALLALLARVISGEVTRQQVLVNLTDRCWQQAPAGESPPMPATINGRPVCVVGHEPEIKVTVEPSEHLA